MTNGTKQAAPPAMNTASPTDELRCDKCGEHKLRHDWNCENHIQNRCAAPVGQGSAPAFNGVAKCSPELTQCPRCNNPHHACDRGQGSATSGEAATIERAAASQEDFEAWSKREGAFNLKPAGDAYCEDFRFPATYYYSNTETAWRAWANGRAALAAKAEQPYTAGAAKGGNTCPECGGSLSTWKCTCNPIWPGYFATPVAERAAAPASVPEGNALSEMEARKDAARLERNQVVAALAKCFPSGVARTAIEGWSEDWHGCVYIDLPPGQVSWHFHDSHAYLFDGLPPYAGTWDGHDTPEKYRRLAALAAPEVAQPAARGEGIEELVRDLYNFQGGRHFAVRLEKLLGLATPAPTAGEPSATKGGAA